MAQETITRVHYYQRQFLGAEDFNSEQMYHRDMRRRHHLAQHTWGIVTGLELVVKDREGDTTQKNVFIAPGYAIDGFGREIVVLHTQPLDASLFAAFSGTATLSVWITYATELGKRPAAGFEDCEALDQYGRVSETFGILVEPKGDEHDPVIVDDKTAVPYDPAKTPAPNTFVLPADGATPYQEFPDDDDRPSWRIKLGNVVWDGAAHAFRDTSSDTLREGRIYAGAVADKVLAPASSLRIGPRTPFADPAKEKTFAAVEGPLRIDGDTTAKADVYIHGGKASFQGPDGAEDNVPLWAARLKNPTGPGVDLRVHIGDPFKPAEPAKLARFSVGPVEGGKEKTVFAVRNDDTAEMPTGSLEFRDAKRQFVNVEQAQYGVGYQSAALYFRTDGDFYWYRGGSHKDANGDAGTGGFAMMRLDAAGKLHALRAAQVHGDLQVDGKLRAIGEVRTDTNVIIAPDGDAVLRTRHIHGKESGADFIGPLFLNWNTGKKVVVGRAGGPTSDFEVNGNASIAGNFSVTGSQNLFKARSQTFALKNMAADTPRTWTYSHAGEFSEIYTAFVVLQGFSLWDNDGNTAFPANAAHHVANADAIPQHVFVRVTSSTLASTSGEVYCAESKASLEPDNTVLFTVVVMGRP